MQPWENGTVLLAVVSCAPDDVLPALTELGHTIRRVDSAHAALALDPDAVLIDAREQHAWAQQSCLILSALPVLLVVNSAQMPALDPRWGFTDFVAMAASTSEIALRIRLLDSSTVNLLHASGITIDESGYTATAHGRSLDLTYTEFELLKFLVAHPGRVFTRDQLVTDVWGYDYYGGTRTVDVHVRRLRAKLGPELDSCIETVRNVGYRFTPKA
ncbi:MAG: winged helix-turn-helix transcriptional regulator [Propionibacteriaceae bacterium]